MRAPDAADDGLHDGLYDAARVEHQRWLNLQGQQGDAAPDATRDVAHDADIRTSAHQ